MTRPFASAQAPESNPSEFVDTLAKTWHNSLNFDETVETDFPLESHRVDDAARSAEVSSVALFGEARKNLVDCAKIRRTMIHLVFF